jgi:hypothetical protein
LDGHYQKGEGMNRIIMLWLIGMGLLFIFVACGININKRIDSLLVPDYLNSKTDIKEIDLSEDGQCPNSTLPVFPINIEERTEKYKIYDVLGVTHYFEPKKLVEQVVEYTKLKLIESNLKVDEQHGKKILISLVDATSTGEWVFENTIRLKIEIPEINYRQVYAGVEGSGHTENATAYAINIAINKFLNDHIFQKYVKCQ